MFRTIGFHPRQPVMCSFLLAGVCFYAVAGAGQDMAPNGAMKTPAFEVVSLRPNKSGSESMQWNFNQNGFTARNITVQKLVSIAYDINYANEVVGLPRWTDSARLDVEAKMSEEAAAPFQKLNAQRQWKEIQSMLQSLLADRFSLKIHRASQELSVYALEIAKDGCKLKESLGEAPLYKAKGHGRIDFEKAQIADLIFGLSTEPDVDRRVIDKTGLTGRYDIVLEWGTGALSEPTSTGNGK
jgi:uncharacterized protein (TIGR03435 family)